MAEKKLREYAFFYADTDAPYTLYRVKVGTRGVRSNIEIAEAKARAHAKKQGHTLAGGYAVLETDKWNNDEDTVVPVRFGQRPFFPKTRREFWLIEGETSCEDYEWSDFCYELTFFMAKKNPKKHLYWRADGYGMGWRKRTGYKYFKAENAEELLQAILPNTDCSIRVKNDRNAKHRMIIRVAHHDAPMGELYKVRPCSEEEYNRVWV